MLARHGVMTELDAGAIARYAVVWCRWVDAEAEIKKRGPVVKTTATTSFRTRFWRWRTNACCRWRRSKANSA